MDSARLAERLGLTAMAVRQHLYALQEEKFVTAEERPGPIGRPAKYWRLTPEADQFFPDAYAELSVALIDAFGRRRQTRAGIPPRATAGGLRTANTARGFVGGEVAATGSGADGGRLHGRSQARRQNELPVHREPLPDLRSGNRLQRIL